MNKNAGRGKPLFVMLRLENGKELPFFVDTGTSVTLFDKSFEAQLGKCLGRKPLWLDSQKLELNYFASPKLYLGNTELITDPNVLTYDFSALASLSEHPIAGVLGMDCLKHYCTQMDFNQGVVRFLNPDKVDTSTLGKAYPLTFDNNLPFIHDFGIAGGNVVTSLVDTGYRADGEIEKGTIKHNDSNKLQLAENSWSENNYTNLLFRIGEKNIVGMRFLARHIVTFNFPKRVMYLKQASVGALAEDSAE